MVSQKITIKNEQGLHMRPAGVFAKAVAPFQSDVNRRLRNAISRINATHFL